MQNLLDTMVNSYTYISDIRANSKIRTPSGPRPDRSRRFDCTAVLTQFITGRIHRAQRFTDMTHSAINTRCW